VGGVECAAIGTDFDGISGNLQIASPNDMPKLFESLAVSGFTADEIEHIAWKNTCRVIKDVFPE
jgi:membrane dipeptidase